HDPIYALSYVYAFSYDEFRNYRNPVPSLLGSYESWKRNKNVNPQLLSAIQYRIASMQFKNKDYLNAERTYRNILVEYPNFYDSIELKKNIGSIEFKRSQNKIPNYYIEVLNNKDATRYDNKTIIQDIIDRFKSIPNRNQRIEIISLLLKEQKEIQRNKELYSLLKYLQAEAHYKNNHFEKSLELIQSYIHNVDSKSYVYLISHLLESRIYRAEEKIIESQKELEYFIKNYNYESGIDVDYFLIEDSLIFYESRARMFEIEGDYKSAIATYNENDEILALSKESKIPIQEIYNKYGTYFQKKYVDSTIDFAFKKNLSEEDFILNQMNIGKDLDTITTTNLARIYGLPIIGELSKPFGDFRDLQFSEWFSKDESKSALEYFESKLDKARSHLDLGTIYGYAYLLTSRAVLLEKKLQDNQSLTLSKKKKILKELKQAEYELNWIIHADPTFTDAYMLLGWIYQYVDISKKRPSYPSGEAEIEEFESAYIATFPTNYLEENVELFNQLLEFLGKNANDKTKFDIHVNLANNFFLLNNYQKSKKNFEIAESLSKSVIKKAAFNDYKKEALFHFNFGRTEIYNGNEAIAIPHFEKAIDLYYNNEYFPSVSQAGNSPNLESLVKLSEAKRKLALLHAIKGSSELNIKNYENSIQSFTVALSMNGFSEYIEDLSLYNALAIAHQKLGNINESDKYLKEAFENYESRRERFKFPSLSIWNLILPEKNRVIGDGKIPGELSLEFNHLLSRGIQIKNNTIEKEFTYTEELIQSRNQWIKDNGMDNTVLGKIILENSLNEIAYNQFLRGNYKRSNELYLQDYELAKKNGNDKLAFQFLKRASLSLFSLIEENREDIDYLIEILHSEIYKLNELKNIEINLCLSRNKNVINCEKEF
ncbi:MAG: tetratricopeptide repeat protein, partial [Leptospira sp.]|nr:tetratricopeptide repeat protein [Leptospira sp.]